MQSTVNLELALTNQIQLSPNSTSLTFYVPSTRATILVINANFPEGTRTTVQYIAAYDTTSTEKNTFSPQLIQHTDEFPHVLFQHVLPALPLPVLPVKTCKKKRATRPIQPLAAHEITRPDSSHTESYPITPDYRTLLDQISTISTIPIQE